MSDSNTKEESFEKARHPSCRKKVTQAKWDTARGLLIRQLKMSGWPIHFRALCGNGWEYDATIHLLDQ
jgi:hypothetical protein